MKRVGTVWSLKPTRFNPGNSHSKIRLALEQRQEFLELAVFAQR